MVCVCVCVSVHVCVRVCAILLFGAGTYKMMAGPTRFSFGLQLQPTKSVY